MTRDMFGPLVMKKPKGLLHLMVYKDEVPMLLFAVGRWWGYTPWPFPAPAASGHPWSWSSGCGSLALNYNPSSSSYHSRCRVRLNSIILMIMFFTGSEYVYTCLAGCLLLWSPGGWFTCTSTKSCMVSWSARFDSVVSAIISSVLGRAMQRS